MWFYRNRILFTELKMVFQNCTRKFFVWHTLCSNPSSVTDYLLHCLRVIEGRKVPNEEAQGEDVAASHHRRWQGEQPARATKKACRQKGPSFYKLVFDALKEKHELLLKNENEKAAREAAATASKQLECRCWWSDYNDGLNDS